VERRSGLRFQLSPFFTEEVIMRRIATTATAMLLLTACEAPRSEIAMPKPEFSLRLESPDTSFRLTPAERASVRAGFDVDALERLLAAVDPRARALVLGGFQYPESGHPARNTVRLGDPALQPLLDEVWAPMWEHLGADALDREDILFPGRDLARQRRDANRSSPDP
jgi:hypothetical protein